MTCLTLIKRQYGTLFFNDQTLCRGKLNKYRPLTAGKMKNQVHQLKIKTQHVQKIFACENRTLTFSWFTFIIILDCIICLIFLFWKSASVIEIFKRQKHLKNHFLNIIIVEICVLNKWMHFNHESRIFKFSVGSSKSINVLIC